MTITINVVTINYGFSLLLTIIIINMDCYFTHADTEVTIHREGRILY